MKTHPVTLRIDPQLLERLDALTQHIAERAVSGLVTRSSVVRSAMLRGLAELERDAGFKAKRKGKGSG